MNFSLPFSVSFLYPAYLWLLLLGPLLLGLGWPERGRPDRRRHGWATALRLLLLLLLALGLAGARLERPVDAITTVFLLDVSDSLSAEDRAEAERYLEAALAEKPAGDRAAVIMFGGDALVEQLPRTEAAMPALASLPVESATNIEAALRLGLALLPGEGGGRLALLSDGRETEGEARQMLDLAAARQVEISIYPLGQAQWAGSAAPEVLMESVSAPAQARQGQTIPVEAVVRAGRPTGGTLRLLAGGRLVEARPVTLVQGANRFRFSLPARETGFRRFRVEVEAAADSRPQNNWGAAFTTVYGPPRLLVVAGQPEEAASLTAALAANNFDHSLISPATLPDDLAALARYEAVILVNVPAADLPAATQERLASFVRDLGRGLIMVGGLQSYGAGGYLRSPLEAALPVEMEVRSRSREPNLALVLAVDKSGSMGACHCDNPDLRQSYTRAPSGLPKIDIVKEAIFQAGQVLGRLDYMGVVSFDSQAHWQLETAPWVGPVALEQAIAGMPASGQTNIYAGLVAAEEALAATPARIKHILLLTDGWSLAGAYETLTDRLAEEGITLSVVAAGNGSAEYLADLARRGGGRYYPAASMSDVPQIFFKETVRASGHYIIEEPFLPAPAVTGDDGSLASPILRGLDLAEAGPLLGYNGTTAKTTARVALLTPRGDPLLATWQYGLGRSAAWTSDLGGRWARAWLNWPDFPRLVGQMAGWSLPAPGDERLELATSVHGGEATLKADLQDGAGRPRNFLEVTARLLDSDGQAIEANLAPGGPGRYQATVPLPAEGVYLAQVTAYEPDGAGSPAPLASRTTGLVLPYSPEYANLAADPVLPADLITPGSGQILREPAQAFAHTLAMGRQTRPVWPLLLLLAALLFPVDVAVRRLRLGRRERQQARAWLSQQVPGRFRRAGSQTDQPVPSTVRALRRVRRRAQQRRPAKPRPDEADPPGPIRPTPAAGERANVPAPDPPTPAQPAGEEEAGDTFSRLRAAKKRARRE